MRILVLNGGTGTVKAAVATATGQGVTVDSRYSVEARPGRDAGALFLELLQQIGDGLESIDAVGHRVVHGGRRFSAPVRIDSEVEAGIAALVPLAPLHNPVALAGIRAARARLPDTPMVAVFDTAFHAGRSQASLRYGLPTDLTEALALYRYGFHGIAHASLAEAAAEFEQHTLSDFTGVTLQLGHGCSACAIRNGASVETSMGFTPLEGLVMTTRAGDIDPALVVYLLRQGRSADEVEDLLLRRSGMLGIAGSDDMRHLLQAEANGDQRAAFAIELFVHRIVMTVGAYFTLLGGAGALVFGGGIGENAAEIRSRVTAGLSAWGFAIDSELNARGRPGRISSPASPPVYAMRTDEELHIARAVARLPPSSSPR
jgi:acetate kinase